MKTYIVTVYIALGDTGKEHGLGTAFISTVPEGFSVTVGILKSRGRGVSSYATSLKAKKEEKSVIQEKQVEDICCNTQKYHSTNTAVAVGMCVCIWEVNCQSYLYLLMTLATASLASSCPNLIPGQFLGPAPKGMYAIGCRVHVARASGENLPRKSLCGLETCIS